VFALEFKTPEAGYRVWDVWWVDLGWSLVIWDRNIQSIPKLRL